MEKKLNFTSCKVEKKISHLECFFFVVVNMHIKSYLKHHLQREHQIKISFAMLCCGAVKKILHFFLSPYLALMHILLLFTSKWGDGSNVNQFEAWNLIFTLFLLLPLLLKKYPSSSPFMYVFNAISKYIWKQTIWVNMIYRDSSLEIFFTGTVAGYVHTSTMFCACGLSSVRLTKEKNEKYFAETKRRGIFNLFSLENSLFVVCCVRKQWRMEEGNGGREWVTEWVQRMKEHVLMFLFRFHYKAIICEVIFDMLRREL